jgi:hypothetical protein
MPMRRQHHRDLDGRLAHRGQVVGQRTGVDHTADLMWVGRRAAHVLVPSSVIGPALGQHADGMGRPLRLHAGTGTVIGRSQRALTPSSSIEPSRT